MNIFCILLIVDTNWKLILFTSICYTLYNGITTRDRGHYYFGLKKINHSVIVSRAIGQFDHEFEHTVYLKH